MRPFMGTVLNRKETAAALGISVATIDRLWRQDAGNSFDPAFPRPLMRNGKVSGWDSNDIEAYKQGSKAANGEAAQSMPASPQLPRSLVRSIEYHEDEALLTISVPKDCVAEAEELIHRMYYDLGLYCDEDQAPDRYEPD